jgi:hypothetical protein
MDVSAFRGLHASDEREPHSCEMKPSDCGAADVEGFEECLLGEQAN